MAKKPANKSAETSTLNIALLQALEAGTVSYASAVDGMSLANHNPPLIDVNTTILDPTDNNKAAVRINDAGKAYLASLQPAQEQPQAETKSPYEIITTAIIPPSKRGNRGGAPTQYPFDKLEVGNTFFVPVSEKHPDPVKKLGSTVSSANNKFSQPTGEMKEVERTKRGEGNKAVKDAAGNNIREKVSVPVKKPLRKFTIRAVVAGQTYGNWVAPANGALIARIL